MRFRPLAINYHSRAQEIVAAERDIHARRALGQLLHNEPQSSSDYLLDGDSHADDAVDNAIASGRDEECGSVVYHRDGKENCENGMLGSVSNDHVHIDGGEIMKDGAVSKAVVRSK